MPPHILHEMKECKGSSSKESVSNSSHIFNPYVNRNIKDSIFLEFDSVEFNDTNNSNINSDTKSKHDYKKVNNNSDLSFKLSSGSSL